MNLETGTKLLRIFPDNTQTYIVALVQGGDPEQYALIDIEDGYPAFPDPCTLDKLVERLLAWREEFGDTLGRWELAPE